MNTDTQDDDPPPKISQDHYRHIHEQRDFTMENLSLAGFTDEQDTDDQKIYLEYEFMVDEDIIEINRQINEESKPPAAQIDYRYRVPEEARLNRRIKNKYQYIGGMPLSMC